VEESDMPLVPDEILDTIAYLYPSEEAAREGHRFGGSAFIVSIPSEVHPDLVFAYVVTNTHVIAGGATVLRVNGREGGVQIIHSTADFWISHPDGDDISVLSIRFEYETAKVRAIPEKEYFLTKERLGHYMIGIGDETVMPGRFIGHGGKERNLPTARFGQISMLPLEPIRTGIGTLQEVFLVECRSLPGYSGSPVFVSPLPLSAIRHELGRSLPHAMLLGIDMGVLKDERQVLNREELRKGRRIAIDKNWAVEANTGMSCVIPAWKIREVLYCDEVARMRKEMDGKLTVAKNESPGNV
jgi:hypothetical protein